MTQSSLATFTRYRTNFRAIENLDRRCSHRSVHYFRSVHTEAIDRLNFKPYGWFYDLSMRRAPLYQIWSGQIFYLDGWCQQDPSTSLPSCLESFGCHCHLQDDTRKVSVFGCKLIKNTTAFFFVFIKLSCRASIQPSLLPFKYSVGQGVHTVPVVIFRSGQKSFPGFGVQRLGVWIFAWCVGCTKTRNAGTPEY